MCAHTVCVRSHACTRVYNIYVGKHTHSLGPKLEWIKISVTSLNLTEATSDEKT